MQLRVRTVCNRRTLNDFVSLPWRIYRDDPHWVPPIKSEVRRTLDIRRNPYFKKASLTLFVCYQDGEAVARVAIVIDREYEEKFALKVAFFGFFECTEEKRAAECLFRAVFDHCRVQGIRRLEGPFNPNVYSELGLLEDHFDTPPSFFQTYNPPYYRGLLENLGFRRATSFFTGRNDNIRQYIQHRYGSMPSCAPGSGYSVRPFSMADLPTDLEVIREVFNDAFASNWHFLPVSAEEYRYSAKSFRVITTPDLVVIAEHHGVPVGVLLCVLDINPLLKEFNGKVGPLKYLQFLRRRRSTRTLIVYAVGIKNEYQRTRVFSLLLAAMCRIAVSYDTLESTWMSENNILAVKAAERLGMTPYKHFGMYGMKIDP